MRLDEYLSERKISQAAFARLLDVAPSLVHAWLANKKRPSLTMAQKVGRATDGAVTPNDWPELAGAENELHDEGAPA